MVATWKCATAGMFSRAMGSHTLGGSAPEALPDPASLAVHCPVGLLLLVRKHSSSIAGSQLSDPASLAVHCPVGLSLLVRKHSSSSAGSQLSDPASLAVHCPVGLSLLVRTHSSSSAGSQLSDPASLAVHCPVGLSLLVRKHSSSSAGSQLSDPAPLPPCRWTASSSSSTCGVPCRAQSFPPARSVSQERGGALKRMWAKEWPA